jgi:hypothetical protein
LTTERWGHRIVLKAGLAIENQKTQAIRSFLQCQGLI